MLRTWNTNVVITRRSLRLAHFGLRASTTKRVVLCLASSMSFFRISRP